MITTCTLSSALLGTLPDLAHFKHHVGVHAHAHTHGILSIRLQVRFTQGNRHSLLFTTFTENEVIAKLCLDWLWGHLAHLQINHL